MTTETKMPDRIWAASYYSHVNGEQPLKEWDNKKITGSTEYTRAVVTKEEAQKILTCMDSNIFIAVDEYEEKIRALLEAAAK